MTIRQSIIVPLLPSHTPCVLGGTGRVPTQIMGHTPREPRTHICSERGRGHHLSAVIRIQHNDRARDGCGGTTSRHYGCGSRC